MEFLLFIGTVFVGVGGYRFATRRKDWWMYTYLPAVAMAVPFGLALAFSSVAAFFKGHWGRVWEQNLRVFLITAAISIVAFVLGSVIGFLQRPKR